MDSDNYLSIFKHCQVTRDLLVDPDKLKFETTKIYTDGGMILKINRKKTKKKEKKGAGYIM